MTPRAIIFGCGNILLGDDGFGPAVIAALENSLWVGPDIQIIDAGTGIREYLFDYILSPEHRPDIIIILDAVDFNGCQPGELMEIDHSAIPAQKIHDFSLHQFPTVNLLQELSHETGIEVRILAAQVAHIPDHIAPGLSSAMIAAVPAACNQIKNILSTVHIDEGMRS